MFVVPNPQVVPCDKTWRHDYATCPFAHAGESSERRHPSAYLPFMCGSTQHSTDLKEVRLGCLVGVGCWGLKSCPSCLTHPGVHPRQQQQQQQEEEDSVAAVIVRDVCQLVAVNIIDHQQHPTLTRLLSPHPSCSCSYTHVQQQKCPFGTACKYAHGHFELWLHPGRFRTKLCSLGANCKRPVCFFAHSEHELRVTPYSKLDTAASVAAQQLAEAGQELDANISLLGGNSCSSSIMGDFKAPRPASSINSPGSSECGAGTKRGGGSCSSSTSPTNSLSMDDATALAKLTASMAALGAPAPAPLLNVGGMTRLQNSAYLAAAAAAVDASLSGSADMSLSGPGLWPLSAGSGMLCQQQQVQQQQLPTATMAYNTTYLQQQVPILEPQMLGTAAPGQWLVPSSTAGQCQWPAVPAARTVLVQQQQPQCNFGLGAPAASTAPCAAALAPGLPVQTLLGPAGLDQQWLQFDAVPASLCCSIGQQPQPQAAAGGSQTQAMQQYVNQQAMQHLLGLLDVPAAH